MTEQKTTRGNHFEMRVGRRLAANFPECTILHDVSIPGRKRKPTQIDFILLDETGIYVIEAKGYSGEVTGDDTDIYWKKTFIKENGIKYEKQVLNPLVQNAGHVKYIKRLIDNPNINVFSIVVMSEKCDSSSIHHRQKDSFMFHLKEFAAGIEDLMETSDICLSDSQLEELENRLVSSDC